MTSAKLYIYIGVESRDLFIDEAHMALGIFPVYFPACCLLRFVAFFFSEHAYFRMYEYDFLNNNSKVFQQKPTLKTKSLKYTEQIQQMNFVNKSRPSNPN